MPGDSTEAGIFEDDYDRQLRDAGLKQAALAGSLEEDHLPAQFTAMQFHHLAENVKRSVPPGLQSSIVRAIADDISADNPEFDRGLFLREMASRLGRPDVMVGSVARRPRLAGFAGRAAAWWVDSLILALVGIPVVGTWVICMALLAGALGWGEGGAYLLSVIGGGATVLLLRWLYFSLLESRAQATLGKMLLGLRVTDTNGNPIPWRTANLRFWGRLISELSVVGLLIAPFTRHRQAFHDKIAKTVVVHRGSPPRD